jgi:hypothetical protein
VFIRDCTVVSGMALLLFGGPLTVLHEAGQLLINGWLRIKAAAQVGGASPRATRPGAGGSLYQKLHAQAAAPSPHLPPPPTPAPCQVGVLVKKLRDAVDALLLAAIAGDRGGGGNGSGGGGAPGGGKVVDTIRQLLVEAEAASER